jgi:hypothetical protein
MYPDPLGRVSESTNTTASVAETASKVIVNNLTCFPGAGNAR